MEIQFAQANLMLRFLGHMLVVHAANIHYLVTYSLMLPLSTKQTRQGNNRNKKTEEARELQRSCKTEREQERERGSQGEGAAGANLTMCLSGKQRFVVVVVVVLLALALFGDFRKIFSQLLQPRHASSVDRIFFLFLVFLYISRLPVPWSLLGANCICLAKSDSNAFSP